MAVPDFQSLMLPTLKAMAGQGEMPVRDIRGRVADDLGLTDEDREQTVGSGRQTLLVNRVSWAIQYMMRADLVSRPQRGVYRLTDKGEELAKQPPKRIDTKFLRRYPEYREWQARVRTTPASGGGDPKGDGPPRPGSTADDSDLTPDEAVQRAAEERNKVVEAEVLQKVIDSPPDLLERTIVDVLIAMGYGGGRADRGWVTGGPGDGGIDGTIREDVLGLDEIYVQAKRYAVGNNVGPAAVRDFAGALGASGSTKGVFVTTSSFTKGARDFADKTLQRIILIDGGELARLMLEHDVGVRLEETIEIKRIDEDYFNPDD